MITYFTDLISCTEVIDNEQYLKLDPEVVCWKGWHLLMFCFGGLFLLVVYIIGFPYISLRLLGKSDLKLPGNQLRYGMLFDGYNDKYWWWEITVIFRKLFIIIIGTFVKDTQQILCVLFVLAGLIFLTAYHQPFLYNKLLYLELGSLSLAFFTFWVGGMLITDPKCADESGFWCECSAYFVALVNVIGIFYLAYVFATAKWKEKADVIIGMVKKRFKCCFTDNVVQQENRKCRKQHAWDNTNPMSDFKNKTKRSTVRGNKRKSRKKKSSNGRWKNEKRQKTLNFYFLLKKVFI